MSISEKNILVIIAITIVIFISIGSICCIKAVARDDCFTRETDAAETEFRTMVKDVLKEYGASKAGITMTKRCEDGHSFEYNVEIHLPSYINLENGKEETLIEKLEDLKLDVRDSNVKFSFS